MLRQKLLCGLQTHGGAMSPFLLLAGILVMLLLPTLASRKIFIDENSIGHMSSEISVPQNTISNASSEVQWDRRLVRGKRSSGSEVVAVYVNTVYDASVRLANGLVENLLTRDDLACDVEFYFVSDFVEWPVPRGYARSALVLNFSTLRDSKICIELYGQHGLQPNQDLASLAIRHAIGRGLNVSLLCQIGKTIDSTQYGPTAYYIKSLEGAVLIDRYPRPWHTIPTRGINTVAFSSDSGHAHITTTEKDAFSRGDFEEPLQFAYFLLSVIMSLNGLDEKFHHASFGYISVKDDVYVPHDVAQVVIYLFTASIISTVFCIYQLSGFSHLQPVALLSTFALTPITDFAHKRAGLPGLIASTALFIAATGRATLNLEWISANAVAVILMEALQPSTGILCGAGVALQLFFLHPMCAKPVLLFFGTVVSWVTYYYFVWHLRFGIWCTTGTSSIFVSVFLYPNAVWVSSRLLRYLTIK